MSEKREKQIRRIAHKAYDAYFNAWIKRKPSRWRIFRYLRWKKSKPEYQRIEKQVKDLVKSRG